MRVGLRMLAVPFVVALASALQAQSPSTPALDIREVHVVPGSISISSIVRIGLQNTSAVARLVCIGAHHLAVRPAGDSYAEGGAGDCQVPGPSFFAIPPGGLYFIDRSVMRTESRPEATIQVALLLFHARADDPRAVEMIDVAWQGSVREAEEAARRSKALAVDRGRGGQF